MINIIDYIENEVEEDILEKKGGGKPKPGKPDPKPKPGKPDPGKPDPNDPNKTKGDDETNTNDPNDPNKKGTEEGGDNKEGENKGDKEKETGGKAAVKALGKGASSAALGATSIICGIMFEPEFTKALGATFGALMGGISDAYSALFPGKKGEEGKEGEKGEEGKEGDTKKEEMSEEDKKAYEQQALALQQTMDSVKDDKELSDEDRTKILDQLEKQKKAMTDDNGNPIPPSKQAERYKQLHGTDPKVDLKTTGCETDPKKATSLIDKIKGFFRKPTPDDLEKTKTSLQQNTTGGGEPGEPKPDTGKPDTGKPDTGKPDTGKPDTGKPDTGKPDTKPKPQKDDPNRPGMHTGPKGGRYYVTKTGTKVYLDSLMDYLKDHEERVNS